MKKLFLIGDSIRMGYCEYVKAALAGKAEVFWHEGNARFAEYTLCMLGDWENDMRLGQDLACVHWNVGLHDCIRMAGEEPLTPPDFYAYYIDRICKRLRFYYPRAEMIFATSTPVQEEKYGFWFARKNADIVRCNQLAVDIVKKHGMAVNDLHALLEKEDADAVHSDLTHFDTPLGRELITKAVLRAVCPALGVDYGSLVMPDFSEKIHKDKDILA